MSSLWTPGGEHEVPRPGADRAPTPAPPTPPSAPGPAEPAGPAGNDPMAGMSPEERAQAEAMVTEMVQVREQLASVPAAVVVANHAMGLYELAAVHLSQQPPNLTEAEVAIDSLGALLGSVKGRLGADEGTLTDALDQLRMAFVTLRAQNGGQEPGGTAAGAAAGDAPPVA